MGSAETRVTYNVHPCTHLLSCMWARVLLSEGDLDMQMKSILSQDSCKRCLSMIIYGMLAPYRRGVAFSRICFGTIFPDMLKLGMCGTDWDCGDLRFCDRWWSHVTLTAQMPMPMPFRVHEGGVHLWWRRSALELGGEMFLISRK